MRTEGEFRALLVLLGDEDERVAGVARETLLNERDTAVPYLLEAAGTADPRLRGRVRLLLEEIRVTNLEAAWRQYVALPDDDFDLERGALLISGLLREVDSARVSGFLDAIAGMVRAHRVHVGPLQALSEVLFENMGFRGGDYGEPDNYYLVPALDRRTGIPIVLATLFVLVGRRIGLPVSGVAAPSHYLARVEDPEGPIFVDCYNRGRTYRQMTLIQWLEGRGVSRPEQYLTPCTHRFTLYRMLNNCERVHGETGDTRLAEAARRWREVLQTERA
ncbi:MAG TPA: transglutaminase-like domain-containing protein [Symbiobacteriaceae bacterium]|nr:transglutaminase-like domain-containing protein [Symbiobacteriaceae bacterium]